MAGAEDEGESDPLAIWYLEAGPFFSALDDCRDIVRELRSEAVASPLECLHDFSAITQESEVWLLTHPYPDPLHGEHLESILKLFMFLGELFADFQDNLAMADDGTLDRKIAQIEWTVDTARQIRGERIARGRRRA